MPLPLSFSPKERQMLTPANLLKYPELLVVDFSEAFRPLDRLVHLSQRSSIPLIDVDATMSQVVEALNRPADFSSAAQYVDFMVESVFNVTEAEDFEHNYKWMRQQFIRSIIAAEQQLRVNGLQINPFFPYDYVERKRTGRALLRRKASIG